MSQDCGSVHSFDEGKDHTAGWQIPVIVCIPDGVSYQTPSLNLHIAKAFRDRDPGARPDIKPAGDKSIELAVRVITLIGRRRLAAESEKTFVAPERSKLKRKNARWRF